MKAYFDINVIPDKIDVRKAKYLRDSVTVVERVAGLINFRNIAQHCEFHQSSEGDRLHPDNSWCTQEFADSLQLAIYDFYDWCLSGNLNILISINDMCLPYGGRFDVNGKWGGRYGQGHYYHRVGTSVDLNRTLTASQLRVLTDFMNDHGLIRYPEIPIHFGIKYRNGNISY